MTVSPVKRVGASVSRPKSSANAAPGNATDPASETASIDAATNPRDACSTEKRCVDAASDGTVSFPAGTAARADREFPTDAEDEAEEKASVGVTQRATRAVAVIAARRIHFAIVEIK
mmetsp:Transcript_4347/g.12151  ORF Transcript_4347/g.12151 Transcript_4347/m.12151 type:complete len:117 (-) Transcript_4347:22-372(-)